MQVVFWKVSKLNKHLILVNRNLKFVLHLSLSYICAVIIISNRMDVQITVYEKNFFIFTLIGKTNIEIPGIRL